jgi:hypothetical protein
MAGRKRNNATRVARGAREAGAGMTKTNQAAEVFSAALMVLRGGRVNSDPRAPWLERHCGPLESQLRWIAEALRASRTKEQRLELAAALDQLSLEMSRRKPEGKSRGRPPTFGMSIWTSVALVHALMDREKVSQDLAVRAVVADDEKHKQYLERSLRRLNAGDAHPRFGLSYYEFSYEIVRRRLRRLARMHRTK